MFVHSLVLFLFLSAQSTKSMRLRKRNNDNNKRLPKIEEKLNKNIISRERFFFSSSSFSFYSLRIEYWCWCFMYYIKANNTHLFRCSVFIVHRTSGKPTLIKNRIDDLHNRFRCVSVWIKPLQMEPNRNETKNCWIIFEMNSIPWLMLLLLLFFYFLKNVL